MSDVVNGSTSQSGFLGQIMLFAAKTCIVVIAISVGGLFVVNSIIENLEDAAARMTFSLPAQFAAGSSMGARQAWAKIEQELDRAADPSTDLPPEKKQKLINDVHTIVARWRPFIDAVQTEMQKPASAN
jgi:hypothetical protein